MSEILTTEIKSDLQNIYKATRELLNMLEEKSPEDEGDQIHELLSLIRLRLGDIEGTLQKDIFNCNYLITKE
ncbi:hypothetical protein DFR58_10955 [Anaerobacterium chartisolvens]|uniref:Uncharacterized protein n=1 Tax=Anaerobacterium chartisolvens TaxID=1297424 RepID=A0A369B8A7_9FIRM|nr:hypothetical protein [Anaerobacterium chartisolvens]RCX16828.1 hypothetical protein DFR58_10955 [Anaerobacterium chartisolvens]